MFPAPYAPAAGRLPPCSCAAVRPSRRKAPAVQLRRERAAEEGVGHPGEDARAVSGVGLAAAAAAVGHAHEHRVRVAHDLVRCSALQVRHHPNAAAVTLERRVVQALLGREA